MQGMDYAWGTYHGNVMKNWMSQDIPMLKALYLGDTTTGLIYES